MYVGLNLHSYPCPQVLGLRDLLRVTSELGRGHWLLQKSLWAPNLFWWGPKHPQSGNRSRIGWCKALGVGLGVLLPFLLPLSRGGAWRPELPRAWAWAWSFGCVPRHWGGLLIIEVASRDTLLQGAWVGMECQRENRETRKQR